MSSRLVVSSVMVVRNRVVWVFGVVIGKLRMLWKLVKLLLLLKLVLLWKNSSMLVKVRVWVMIEKYMLWICEWKVK